MTTKRYHKGSADEVSVFDELPIWSAPFGLKLLDYVVYRKGITALDIGFGTGFPLTELAMRLGKSSVVYGIDPWSEAIKRTQLKLDHYLIENVRIIEGVAESIPLEDKSVDLITSNNGINNVSDRDRVFAECARICRKDAQFLQTMNLDKSMFEFYSQMEYVLRDMGLTDVVTAMHQHIAAKRPPIDSILAGVRQHGFVVKDLVFDQFEYRFVDASAMLEHQFIRLFKDAWVALVPESKAVEIFQRIETRLNDEAARFGCCKLTIPYVLINAVKSV